MQLNHLNLCVDDLPEAINFFRDLFAFRLLDQKGDAIAVMHDDCGFTLVLSSPRAFGGEAPTYPKDFHVGFYVETPDEVDRMYRRLAAAHIAMDQEPRNMRGGYTLYFRALGGILFEVTCLSSSI